MTPPIKLVIFDIAGTIIEDHGEVLGAFSAALRKNGIPFTPDELKRRKGASKREVIRHFVEQLGPNPDHAEQVESTYGCFRDELQNLYAQRINPIAGAAETFAWCREHGGAWSDPDDLPNLRLPSLLLRPFPV